MSLYTILAMGIRFLEAGCDEQAVADAVANQIKEHHSTPKEILDAEMEFLSKQSHEEFVP
jgi:hypothetical protein